MKNLDFYTAPLTSIEEILSVASSITEKDTNHDIKQAQAAFIHSCVTNQQNLLPNTIWVGINNQQLLTVSQIASSEDSFYVEALEECFIGLSSHIWLTDERYKILTDTIVRYELKKLNLYDSLTINNSGPKISIDLLLTANRQNVIAYYNKFAVDGGLPTVKIPPSKEALTQKLISLYLHQDRARVIINE